MNCGPKLPLAIALAVLAACEGRSVGPSRREQALGDLATLEAAVLAYARDHDGQLPEALDPLVRPFPDGRHYLPAGTSALFDPWGRRFVYAPEGSEFRLESLGRDGEPGGEGDDADLGRADLERGG